MPPRAAGRPRPASAPADGWLPELSAFGIARLADHTGLDEIGLPVWAAIRPMARSLSLCHGKGLTHAQARLSAVMEAAETARAEMAETGIVATGTFAEVEARGLRPVHPGSMLRCTDPSAALGHRLGWLFARGIVSRRRAAVPVDLVSLDFRITGTCPSPAFYKTSVGLAAHWSRDHAVLHGLLEAIEYDAVALARPWAGLAVAGATPHLGGPASSLLGGAIAMAEAAGQVPVFVDITSDIGVPTVLCRLDDRIAPAGSRRRYPFAGHASRLDIDSAALAALLEAAQSRLTDIAGAREDILPSSYRIADAAGAAPPSDAGARAHVRAGPDTARGALTAAGAEGMPAPQDAVRHHWPDAEHAPRAAMAAVVARMTGLGLPEPLVVDLGRQDDGVHCVSVLCPGLEAGPAHEGYRCGQRARLQILRRGLGLR